MYDPDKPLAQVLFEAENPFPKARSWKECHPKVQAQYVGYSEAVADKVRLDLNRGWISVEERLPEQLHTVLVYYNGYAPSHGVNTINSYGDWCYDDERVTHWMPLPEAPSKARSV